MWDDFDPRGWPTMLTRAASVPRNKISSPSRDLSVFPTPFRYLPNVGCSSPIPTGDTKGTSPLAGGNSSSTSSHSNTDMQNASDGCVLSGSATTPPELPQKGRRRCSQDNSWMHIMPVHSPADLTGTMNPNQSGQDVLFCTKDMMTEPPTLVRIVTNPALLQPPKGGGHGAKRCSLPSVHIDDIEPTAGWLSERSSGSITICFMHSFGKCTGRGRDNDRSTCHQLHIKREVLQRLRESYRNPQRRFFCRTMKANITEAFRQVLTLLARRTVTVRYLEFKLEDIESTVGSMEYEVQYRHWLLHTPPIPADESGCAKRVSCCAKTNGAADDPPAAPHTRHGQTSPCLRSPDSGRPTANYISTSTLCWDFALTESCAKGASCPMLHALVARTMTKDHDVKAALLNMAREGLPGAEAPPNPPRAPTGARHAPNGTSWRKTPPKPPFPFPARAALSVRSPALLPTPPVMGMAGGLQEVTLALGAGGGGGDVDPRYAFLMSNPSVPQTILWWNA